MSLNTGEEDLQTILERVFTRGEPPREATDVARSVAVHLGLSWPEARSWTRDFLTAEIAALSAVIVDYPFEIVPRVRGRILVARRPRGDEPDGARIRKTIESTAPYLRARVLHALYSRRAVTPPFPSLDDVGSQVGVAPDRLADCIRIAMFLPPVRLHQAGISWRNARLLDHESLVTASLAGTIRQRMDYLMDQQRRHPASISVGPARA